MIQQPISSENLSHIQDFSILLSALRSPIELV